MIATSGLILFVLGISGLATPHVDCTEFALPESAYAQIAERAHSADAILIGEVHRRTAAPCVMIELSGHLDASGNRVNFAFEEGLQDGVEEALALRDDQGVLTALLTSDSWRAGPWDGRQSLAWYTAIGHALALTGAAPERLAWLMAGESLPGQSDKRDLMTDNLVELLARQPEDAITLAIMGNNWTGNPVDSVCAAARREGYDILCLEVDDDPGRTCPAEGGAWRIGPPSRMRMVSPQDDPVDLVLLSPCERRSQIAARVFGIAEEPF